MLNHNEVIEKLTTKQKFALLTDIGSLSDPDMDRAGVPHVSVLTLETLMNDSCEGLSPSRLANSWDTSLIQRVSCKAVTDAEGTQAGTKLVMTPAAKPGLNVYQAALSEDPFLSGSLAAAYADGVRMAGSGCCPEGFYVTQADVEQLDTEPDMTAIGEMILKPYVIAIKDKGYESILTDNTPLKDKYRSINHQLSATRTAEELLDGTVRLCRPRNHDETLAAILNGDVVIKGGTSALESAYEKYRYIVKAIEDEIVTMEDLDEALEDGSAISDEMLDHAVARILDFAHALAQVPKQEVEVSDSLRKEAFLSSGVLLKNHKGLLPLKPRNRVAIIGGTGILSESVEEACRMAGVQVIGRMEGYDPDTATGAVDVTAARELAKKADRVLVLLGRTPEMDRLALQSRELTLPASQVELLHGLSGYKDKVIGVLDCEYAVDTALAEDTAALLLMPLGGADSIAALVDLLVGKVCPSGKLASTLYDHPSEHFDRLRQCKNAGKNAVGTFLGYRHYDSAGINVSFPFGHGLSYTSFKYSDLRIANGEAVFTVKNTGSRVGSEIAQIYIGKPDSARLRPHKELYSFTKVTLKPGEKCEIRVNISLVSFYNAETDTWAREAGEYVVYVGSSVKDIRLSRTVRLDGEAYTPSTAKHSDYLQTRSNILSDGYAVEAKPSHTKPHWKLRLASILLAVLAVAVALYGFVASGMVLRVLPDTLPQSVSEIITGIVSDIATSAIFDLFPSFIVNAIAEISFACGGVCLAGSLALLIWDICRRVKSKKQRKAEAELAKTQHLMTATEKEFNAIEELFVEEFDTVVDTVETVVEEQTYADDTAHYIDLNYTLPEAVHDLERYMESRGMEFASTGALQLISALAASRLTVVDVIGADRDEFYRALAEYLGSPVCVETVTDEYAATHLMFCKGEDGGSKRTALADLVESAKAMPNTIHLAVLRGIRAEDLLELFMPYVKYFSNPLRENRIIVKDPVATFTLPSNLWFMAELAEGESLASAQAGILKTVAHLQLSLTECEAAADQPSPLGLGYYQFDHFIQQRKGRFTMDEDLWKKIDELEAYVASHVTFHISNKQWLQLEKYLAMLTVEEADTYAALDHALCVNLLPVITALLKGRILSGEKDLSEAVEQIFGEDKLPLCSKAAKAKEAAADASEPKE